jgi:hypothetical protein
MSELTHAYEVALVKKFELDESTVRDLWAEFSAILAASEGQAEPTAWEKTRSLLITAVWAFSKIPAHERTADAAAQAVDAITDAGSPLSWLRNPAPTPESAGLAEPSTVCETCGEQKSHVRNCSDPSCFLRVAPTPAAAQPESSKEMLERIDREFKSMGPFEQRAFVERINSTAARDERGTLSDGRILQLWLNRYNGLKNRAEVFADVIHFARTLLADYGQARTEPTWDERGAFAYPTIEHWLTEIAGEREIGHVISEMTHLEVARQAFAAARATASPVSGAAGDDARDAKRYRQLRECNSGSLVIVQITGMGEDDQVVLTEGDADAAIDAEIERIDRAEIERGERAGDKS